MKYYSVKLTLVDEPKGISTCALAYCMCCSKVLDSTGGSGDFLCQTCLDKMRAGQIRDLMLHAIHEEAVVIKCDVEGCDEIAACGGISWPDTGYWQTCSKHSREYDKGNPKPQLKQSAIDRENSRGPDGCLSS